MYSQQTVDSMFLKFCMEIRKIRNKCLEVNQIILSLKN